MDNENLPPGSRATPSEWAFQRFREAMPEHGFTILAPPPTPDGSFPDCLASVWRRNDARSIRHRGRSPGEALEKAVRAEHAARRRSETLRDCPLCHGIGWSVGKDGTVPCGHAATVAE